MTNMSRADLRRVKRLLTTTDKLFAQMDDAVRLGTIGSWRATGGYALEGALLEFYEHIARVHDAIKEKLAAR